MSVGAEPGGFFYVLDEEVRILFADDDPILQEFALVHLSSAKASVQTASDGERALELLEQAPFDILLLDLEMPRLDGFGVLERLRADERFKGLPVIVVTGREDVGAIDRAFLAGATSFVAKPINWRLLSYQIRYVHRGALAERAQDQARRQAAQTVRRLARDGADFLDLALRHAPELKDRAPDYVELLGQLAPSRAA